MDVYLVPIGGDKYELYCEVSDEPAVAVEEPAQGVIRRFVRRLLHRFRTMLAEAERERRQGHPEPVHGWWVARTRARIMRWVAESIAEQRLLWHLRRQPRACLFYPDDIPEADAVKVLRDQLGRDFDRHRRWLAIDSVLLVASAALTLVPGPNLVAYYFGFRVVGHFLSLRGARHGLLGVVWTQEKSAPLSDLRRVSRTDDEIRDRQVDEVAARLRLDHFASFFKRTVLAP